jgi:hypothetical protein
VKRGLLTASIFLAVLLAQAGIQPNVSIAAENPKKADLLFVHNANQITVADGKLILKGISPTILFFTDRPERIAGHMTNERYFRLWKEDGKDSFLADPPNATVSVFADDKAADMVVTLRDPRFNGGNLTYEISVIQGKLPEKGGPGAVFIDIIGMPRTPISYAGRARRAVYRRW